MKEYQEQDAKMPKNQEMRFLSKFVIELLSFDETEIVIIVEI